MRTGRIYLKYVFVLSTACLTIFSLVSGISKIEAYYHSGRVLEKMHPGFATSKNDLPNIKYIKDQTVNSNDYIKKQILKEYRLSWNWLNTCLRENDWRGLEDHFTSDLALRLKSQNNQKREQNVLEHKITLKHLSKDYTIAVLHDRAKLIDCLNSLTGGLECKTKVSEFDVFMILEDGRWKIFNWIEKEALESVKEGEVPPLKLKENLEKIKNIRGINYYPQESPWTTFWPNFNQNTIEKDFQEIKSMGFNTVRIFLTMEYFGRNEVNKYAIKEFDLLIEIAKKYDLYLLPTLFDFPIGYDISKLPTYYRQLTFFAEKYQNNDVIIAWNLKNELDLDFKFHDKDKVIAWAEAMLNIYKSIDKNHPVSIAWAEASNINLLENQVDYISIHFYGKIDDLEESLKDRKEQGKIILIEEFGQPSNAGILNLYRHNEGFQFEDLKSKIEFFEKHELPWMIWTLYDFTIAPKSVFGINPFLRNSQKGFGILDKKGRRKPICEYITGVI